MNEPINESITTYWEMDYVRNETAEASTESVSVKTPIFGLFSKWIYFLGWVRVVCWIVRWFVACSWRTVVVLWVGSARGTGRAPLRRRTKQSVSLFLDFQNLRDCAYYQNSRVPFHPKKSLCHLHPSSIQSGTVSYSMVSNILV